MRVERRAFGPALRSDAVPELSTEPILPLAAADVGAWDDRAEVVVVGLGVAGTCAAIEAAEAGADVLALERSGAGGGTSANSGGIVYLGGGTPIQEACGFHDTAEDMFAFLVAACGPGADEAKIRPYCDCLLYTSPSPRDRSVSRMPSSA